MCVILIFSATNTLFAQIIRNEGAAIFVVPGTFVGSKDAYNNPGGKVENNGEINLSGSYFNAADTWGNGLFRIGENWTNSGVFIPGSSTVVFNGADNQLITKPGGEIFFNLSIFNSGASSLKSVRMSNDVNVLGTLQMSAGNVDAGTFVLYLSNPAAAALNYTSTTGSRIFGKFEREINETNIYLFPLGTASHYNPANIKPNNILSPGSLLSQFFSAPPGNNNLPIPDPPVEIWEAYPGGLWRFTSNTFSSNNFNINMNAAGFLDAGGIPDTIRDITRVIKRTTGGPWIVDGTHLDAAGSVVSRQSLTGDISQFGSEFALGRARPLIISHPLSLIQCEHTDAVFSVTASGAGPLSYRWYKDGVIITNGPDYSGARTATLTVLDINLTDAGTYYCIVSDRYRSKTTSNSATLTVMKIPVANVTPSAQDHECSNIAFDSIALGMSYYDIGSKYVWTRNNPAGIISAIPLSGTKLNIEDTLSGSFTNTTDDPIKITFIITPVGALPTECVGLPVEATVTVNPTPRVLVNNIKQICYGGSTQIVLTSPTHMTQGIVQYDYTVSTTALPPVLIGNTTSANNLPRDITISLPYWNNSDTMQSVFYHVLPKNVISGCNSGNIVSPQVKVHPKPLQNLYISVPFTCAGGSGGVITSDLSKVTKPDKIHWTRPWLSDTTYYTNSNTDSLKVRYEGIYTVTVHDSLGCYNAGDTSVTGAVFNSSLYVKETDTGYGTSCRDSADGEIWIWEEASSTAVAPFEFWLIRNGQDTVTHNFLAGTGFANHIELKSLRSGHYMLLIKDSNGCYNSTYPATEIYDPDPIVADIYKSIYPGNYNISCLNDDDGSAWVNTITGGNGSYRYKWTTSDGLISGVDTLSLLNNITAGTYYLLTTDHHNCTEVDSVTLINPPGISLAESKLSFSPDSVFNIACSGNSTGSIEITIAGGSGNYTYSWSNGATTRNISGLVAGTYIATVTDQANVSCILLPQPTFTLTEPAPLNISVVKSISNDGFYNIDCKGGTGSIDITITGGSPGTYVYTWSTTDGAGIIQGQEDQPSLTAGTYHLIVADANSCSDAIDITLIEPAAMSATLIPKHITCDPPGFNNGSVNLTVNGGVGPYTYSWSNGATSEDILGLTDGKYIVTVSDFNNCTLEDSVIIKLPDPVEYTKSISDYNGYNVSCSGSADGGIDITLTRGQAPFEFSWQKAGGGFTSTSEDITGLRAGQYNLMITDSNRCQASETIELTEPGKLSMTFALSSSTAGGYNINCAGTSTGSIEIIPVNQVGSVKYRWSDGHKANPRINIPAGEYGIIIIDSNGCPADSSVTLTEPDSMKLVFSVKQPWCPDKPDGEIRLTASGGVIGTDYTYKWSDNSTNRDISEILSGLFKVTVTDLNGCSIRDSVNVEPQREICLIIPNAISPNGDLINDIWNIGMIDLYPQIEIKIFNRWGEIVWRSEKGYPDPWDGKSNGRNLPIDSYHYIIDLNNGSKPILGNVTIVR